MARAAALHYIGDEIGAAGWHLAGAAVHVPAPGAEGDALAGAVHGANHGAAPAAGAAAGPVALVLISAATAARVAEPQLQAALATLSPLVLVVPDTQGAVPPPDFAARLRAQLGLEA
ncbi:MAG: hypothetical protein JNL30_17990 [Rubrivivax sp.]|nr:hypothetical protein [Rubrivivax sp.]